MKKFTFLLLLIPFFGFSQTFDFTNSDDGWDVLGQFTATTNATYYTLTTVEGNGEIKNPSFGNEATGVNTAEVSWIGITLKNNDDTGPDFMRVSYPKTTGGRVYKNIDITTGDTDYVIYWIDLTNGNWTGTMDDIKIHFKAAGNTNYVLPTTPISIDVDKIEFTAQPSTTLQNSYMFDTDGDPEGFNAVNGTISGPAAGILTFTPQVNKYAKIDQLSHHVDAANKYLHITLKNNSLLNNQLRLVSDGLDGTKTMEISVNDATENIYIFDLSDEADWSGDQMFTVGIGSLEDGKTKDDGTAEFNSIVFNNDAPASVDAPTFTPPAGTYNEAQSVVIASTTADALIYYTTDDSTPDENSTLYTVAVDIATTTTLKAIAYKAGMTESSVTTGVYTITPDELLADFEADITVITTGNGVEFTDLTIGNPTSWLWSFEGGTPASYDGQTPPTIIYNTAGVYSVTLIVSDGVTTDTKFVDDYITVGDAPVADFEADATEFVAGASTNFTSLSTGDDLVYSWTFEGGTPGTSSDENPMDIFYLIQADATYDVTLTVTNEFGESTLTKEDYIHTTPSGISPIENAGISVYPNPANDYFVINSEKKGEFFLLDASGRVVLKNTFESGSNNVEVSNFNIGIYVIHIVLDDGTKTVSRIIIK